MERIKLNEETAEEVKHCLKELESLTTEGESILRTIERKRKLKKNTCFDLASLTKPLATTMAILCLIKMRKIYVDEKLSSERKSGV